MVLYQHISFSARVMKKDKCPKRSNLRYGDNKWSREMVALQNMNS
ncbi:hypothetical protein LEMLEM_LOCUS4319 [Lemmus lemmus]